MKKVLIGTSLVLVVLVALAAAGLAFAQSQDPTPAPGFNRGYGMMGGRGMMGDGTTGPMHTYMIEALAPRLGLSVEDLQARIDAGETPYQIAQAQGMTDEQIVTLMSEAHTEALQAAVDAGVITQEQADWMSQRMGQMGQNGGRGYRAGGCTGDPQGMGPGMRGNGGFRGRGMMGGGRGFYQQPAGDGN